VTITATGALKGISVKEVFSPGGLDRVSGKMIREGFSGLR
jgi:hypothetical protein